MTTAQSQVSGNKTLDQLKVNASKDIESGYNLYKSVALRIWDYAELGFKEVKSSILLQETLRGHGFTVDSGIAGIPTAFIASYGSGAPVIGILAEFDALPGFSQDSVPSKSPVPKQTNGHACGHHLFGTGSVAAGLAIKNLLASGKLKGTVKVYGCPAEEGGAAKVYMVRDGYFKDVDIVLHWHPGQANMVIYSTTLANISAKFRFYGVSAHAAAGPERGRSALDAVEAMNYMVNLMREHVPQESRIHYVITDGGKAPNVVPDFAEVFYYVRNPERANVENIFGRIVKAAEAAALGTETTMDYEVIHGVHNLLVNKTLATDMQSNLEKIGGVLYTDEEKVFAKKIQESFTGRPPAIDEAFRVQPLTSNINSWSTDVADVSYVVPTIGLGTATWVPGTLEHSWQAVACGGTDIGIKGMLVAAKTLTYTAIDLYLTPALMTKAKEEFTAAVGDYQYKALLGDRKPALNYRD